MTPRFAKKLKREEYEKFDYILGMEERNIDNILGIVGEDTENKVYRLLDFSNRPRDIADPWYTGNFDITYDDIVEGCKSFYEYLVDNKKI
jgi:protein-tyrosine phosphatase